MSMKQLGKRGIPKGTVLSPTRQAILAHLRSHGASTPGPLLEALLLGAVVTTEELARNPYWLNHQLTRLCQQGHTVRHKNDAHVYVWSIPNWDEPAQGATAPAAVETTDPVFVGRVAAPRHIDRMLGPVYQPPSPTPARAGALDFACAPSVIGSRRVPFRSVA